MASIFKNPRLLLVLCMTAGISSAAPASMDEDINVRVYRGNREYAIPSSQVQEFNPQAVPSVYTHREAPPKAYARPSPPDAAINKPGQRYHGRHRLSTAVESRLNTAETSHASYTRAAPIEVAYTKPGQNHHSWPRSNNHQRRRYPARFRQGSTYGGSRYGVRRRIFWNSPEEGKKTDGESKIASPPVSQAVYGHRSLPVANQDKSRRKKWIHCHQDGIAFLSKDADPEIIGI